MIQIISKKYQLHGIANSMQGGRIENQDDMGFQETPLGFLLVVCDGMGGGPGGKTASYIVKYEIMQTLCACNSQTSRISAMKMAVSRANDALYRKMEEVPTLRGMGSTLVAVLINDESAIIVHLGDSRCYRLRGNRVAFQTTDHSLVSELVRNGAMTEEQARVSPQSNVITRALGNTSNHVPAIDEVPYQKGDRFVLCTDGVWGIMPHVDLIRRFSAVQDVATVVTSLSSEIDRIGFAQGGNHDNHTLAVIEMNMDSILKDKMSKQIKIFIAALSVLLAVSLVFNIIYLINLSSKDEINVLIKEIEKLKPYETLYNELSNKDTKESYARVYVLTIQNDSLRKSVDELESKLDSLEAQMYLRNSMVRHESVVGNQRKSEKLVTPQSIAQEIIKELNTLGMLKDTNLPRTVKKKRYAEVGL